MHDTDKPADGHGYTGDFTAAEFNERAHDHDKAAKNGLSAGPNASYVRTFQASAVALRYAAKHMFKDTNAEWNAAVSIAALVVDNDTGYRDNDIGEAIRALRKP